MKRLILLIPILFLSLGCSYVELDDLAIANAIGIDYEDNKFKLTAQIMDVKSSDSGVSEEKSLIYESEGDTMSKAIRNFAVRYPKNVYLGHLEIIVISENSLKKLDSIFDYISRSPEARSSGFVLITDNEKASDILNPKHEVEGTFPAEDLKSILMDASKRNGKIKDITFDEFLSVHLKAGINPTIPLIKTTKEKGITASNLVIKEMAPLKNDKILTPLTNEQVIAYNLINNNFYDIVITPKYKKATFSAIIYNPKSSLDVKLNKKKKLEVTVNIKVESKLSEVDKKINLINRKTQNKINKEIDKELKKYVNSIITYCKNNDVDVLGIGNSLYKNNPKEYKRLKKKNLYKEAKFKIKINNKTYRFGNINKGAA